MSFASDLGDKAPGYASEMKFLKQMTLDGGVVDRRYWNNALAHLKDFIEEKKPLAVGLQEMNLTDEGSETGTDAVKKMLSELGEEYSYNLYSEKVQTNNAGIALIINTNEAGKIEKTDIKDNNNQSNGDGRPTGGRPILMALTEENILFVSMHGAQNGGLGSFEEDFNDYMKKNNKEELEKLVKEFVGDKTVKKAYVMGDFNDRYDAITEFNFKFGDNEVVAKYDGESPAACCFNEDSMGAPEKREKIKKRKGEDEESDKVQGVKGVDFNKETGRINPDHGIKVSDYINKGDKVFAYPKSGELKIYTCEQQHNLDKEGVSIASDHELVYMEIPPDADAEPAVEPAAEPAAPEPAVEPAAEPAAPEPTEPAAEPPAPEAEPAAPEAEPTAEPPAVGGKKYKRKTAKRVSKSKNNKSKKGGKKTKKNNSKKAKKNKSKKSKK